MQKTKLGLSVGLVGMGMFLICFFGGYAAAVILAGYILLFEENMWLKKATVKGIVLLVTFSLLSALIGFIPDIIRLISGFSVLFNGDPVYAEVISKIVNVIDIILEIAEKALFIILGVYALKQRTLKIPVIDPLIDKSMN
ncbi:MAG: hypothetical protein IKZ59_01950 [Clostridia bacterium]|nr:hypothetical protein [Clostridia bacterium]